VGLLAPAGQLVPFAGVQTPAMYRSASEELEALRQGAGVYDLGWRARLCITGEDRVRWLNGMVTNTVKDLAAGQLNYTFLLNAQGRIQGDGTVYALPEALLLATDREQAPRIAAHLDRFVIMDDVELMSEDGLTALGVAGPAAPEVLRGLGFGRPPAVEQFVEQDGMLLAQELPGQFVLWMQPAVIERAWESLLAAGAVACGLNAVEALRILSGVPRYGADIHDKSLAQETGQMRALNFNKGCYLGQEIVERIRSRATVHRGLRSFVLTGETPAAGTALHAADKPETQVGELTSVTSVAVAEMDGIYALGTVRAEAAGSPLNYAGGTAQTLERAPLFTV
jgi:folate-binding protein YgfZ